MESVAAGHFNPLTASACDDDADHAAILLDHLDLRCFQMRLAATVSGLRRSFKETMETARAGWLRQTVAMRRGCGSIAEK